MVASRTWDTQSDWEGGSNLTNIQTTLSPGDTLLDFSQDLGGTPGVNGVSYGSRAMTGGGNWAFVGSNINGGSVPTGTNDAWHVSSISTATGYWRLGSSGFSNNSSFTYVRYLHFMFNVYSGPGSTDFYQGYSLRITGTGGGGNASVALCRHDSSSIGSETVIASFTALSSDYVNGGVLSNYAVIRSPGGRFIVWGIDFSGVRRGSGGSTTTPFVNVVDNTYTSGIYMGIHMKLPNATSSSPSILTSIGSIGAPYSTLKGSWTSERVDFVNTPSNFAPLIKTDATNGGSISYSTMTSTLTVPTYSDVLFDTFTSLAGWTQVNGRFAIVSNQLVYSTSAQDVLYRANTRNYGRWKFSAQTPNAASGDIYRLFFYLGNTLNLSATTFGWMITDGYSIGINFNGNAASSSVSLNRIAGDPNSAFNQIQTVSSSFTNDTSYHDYEIVRDAFGNWTIYRDASPILTVNDNYFPSMAYIAFGAVYAGGATGNVIFVDNLYIPDSDVWNPVSGTTITSSPKRYGWMKSSLDATLVNNNNPSVSLITETALFAAASMCLAFDS
jgi:hypothetical protein